MSNIAIITARGGSKRIPNKNIKDFCGKPIICYSIETALNCKIFDEVMVSTDDEAIAEIAQKAGAKVPFFRSSENSDDFSTTADVLLEVLSAYNQIGKSFETACCIYPTAPFINIELLQNSYSTLIQEKVDTVFPIQEFGFPIQRAVFQNEEGLLSWVQPENAKKRSQDLQKCYHDAGQFYFFDVKKFIESKALLTTNSKGIVISEMAGHDIDTFEDWKIAEFKYKLRHQNG